MKIVGLILVLSSLTTAQLFLIAVIIALVMISKLFTYWLYRRR